MSECVPIILSVSCMYKWFQLIAVLLLFQCLFLVHIILQVLTAFVGQCSTCVLNIVFRFIYICVCVM